MIFGATPAGLKSQLSQRLNKRSEKSDQDFQVTMRKEITWSALDNSSGLETLLKERLSFPRCRDSHQRPRVRRRSRNPGRLFLPTRVGAQCAALFPCHWRIGCRADLSASTRRMGCRSPGLRLLKMLRTNSDAPALLSSPSPAEVQILLPVLLDRQNGVD